MHERIVVDHTFLEEEVGQFVHDRCAFVRFVITPPKETTVSGCNWDIEFENGLSTDDLRAHIKQLQLYTNIADARQRVNAAACGLATRLSPSA